MKIQYGGTNPALDADLENYFREQDPDITDDELLKEMNKEKKKRTFFHEKNSKKNSVKKPKKIKSKDE